MCVTLLNPLVACVSTSVNGNRKAFSVIIDHYLCKYFLRSRSAVILRWANINTHSVQRSAHTLLILLFITIENMFSVMISCHLSA